MALPPRFPGMIPAYGNMALPGMAQLMSFPNPFFMPNPLMAAAAVNSQRMAQPPVPQPKPPERPPVTTVFVGNITDKCGNETIRALLNECGTVATWKRIQGSNSKFQGFGFCEFDNPHGTMRALRILHEYHLAEKKLVVKIDDKTRAMVKEYVANQRVEKGLPPEELSLMEMPADEENAAEDDAIILKITTMIENDAPNLLPIEGQEGELDEKAHSPNGHKSRGESREHDREREREKEREARAEERRKERERKDEERRAFRFRNHSRSRSDSREAHRSRKRSRSGSERSPVKRNRHRSSSSHSAHSGSSSSSSSGSNFTNNSAKAAFRSRSPSRERESDDSDEQRERRALRKQIREKETTYGERLHKWEDREKRQAKLFDKDESREKQRKRDMQKEAKKLKHFLEDYDDERNDPKYYKSSSLFQRRRDFEREKELDAKDRQKEQQEIEELKKQILEENANIENADEEARRRHQEQEDALMRKLRADSGSPNPHRPLGQKPLPVEEEKEEESEESESDSDSDASADAPSIAEKPTELKEPPAAVWKAVTSEDSVNEGVSPSISLLASPSVRSSSLASPAVLKTSSSQITEGSSSQKGSKLNGVFGFEDNDDDAGYKKGTKLKPFEITAEDRMLSMTPEERKQLIKELIARIPTEKDKLFAFPINWDFVDKSLVDQRVKPWVSKKITDYIGEEEASLVDFVCEKVISKTDPQKILSDIAMVLDDEAEVFVVKMWRLLIYESEARKLGLSKK